MFECRLLSLFAGTALLCGAVQLLACGFRVFFSKPPTRLDRAKQKNKNEMISEMISKHTFSLSNAACLSFSDLCILLFMFLSLCRLCVCVFLCSHWSLVDVPLIFFCPADHVPDWQPRVLLGMVEARSVNVKKTTTTTRSGPGLLAFRQTGLS